MPAPAPTAPLRVPLARRVARLATRAEGALGMLARARSLEAGGRDILHLEIGDPDFSTPPHVIRAAEEAIAQGYTHYPPSPGLPELRAAIARHVADSRDVRVDPERVVVAPGSKPIMFYTLMALGSPGVEIVCPDPGMPEFEAVARLTGARVVTLPMDARTGRIDLDRLAAIVTDRTRLVMLISPHNPTGMTLSSPELAGIASIVRERVCYLFSDEIYRAIRFDGPHRSIASLPGMGERTIVSDGFSKTYAMTGWRLGFGVFPTELVGAAVQLQKNSVSAAAAFTQRAGLAALEGPQDVVLAMVAEYRRRRDALAEGLRQISSIECVTPDGGLYAFPRISRTRLTSAEFARRALDEMGVALLPGTAFGRRGEGHVRLSYAAAPVPVIERALERLADLVRRRGTDGRRRGRPSRDDP
jgi:aspartate/methionine/tyrosine aminotransferase